LYLPFLRIDEIRGGKPPSLVLVGDGMMEEVNRPVWPVALAACGLTLALQCFLRSHLRDDAYISFRHIGRLLEGKGLAFNDGNESRGSPVPCGFSSSPAARG
jgi:hypothetical protein